MAWDQDDPRGQETQVGSPSILSPRYETDKISYAIGMPVDIYEDNMCKQFRLTESSGAGYDAGRFKLWGQVNSRKTGIVPNVILLG